MNHRAGTILGLSLFLCSAILGARVIPQSPDIKIIPDFAKPRHQSRSNQTTSRDLTKSLATRERIAYQTGSVAQGQLAELLYKTPGFYPCGYVYTAELRPISGDPDLYLHEKVSGTWRQLKKSVNGAGVVDSFTFTCNDITQSATNVDLDAKGYTAASYEFSLYRETSAGTGAKFMDFPLHNGQTPYTATINAIVDHSLSSGPNCPDYIVVAYTGERGDDQYGLSAFSTPNYCSSPDPLQGYANSSGTAFSLHGQYNQTSGNEYGRYLFYDGHTGYDYPATNGTAVYPVAAGTAYIYSGLDVKVVHPNGYTTYYLHLSSENIYDGQPVTTSTLIGGVGQGHLHLTVMKDTQRADPYGWEGPVGQDPLKVDGADNVCLWNACP